MFVYNTLKRLKKRSIIVNKRNKLDSSVKIALSHGSTLMTANFHLIASGKSLISKRVFFNENC